MKPLFWVGLVVLVLGIASFFFAIPRQERHGITVGDASVGVTTRNDQKVPTAVSIVMLVGGLALMAIGGRK
ncbi:MAG TPA: hypothetical protein VN577_06800 [Terriglobales bacterium]|nr:hypothetical protein [Terriglobales bacterium]